ncbi:MAG: pantothenate kinase [Elainellaceae cyanobacterium]
MPWLSLLIGNTRLHWAKFEQDALVEAWNQPHLALSYSRPCDTGGAEAIATVPDTVLATVPSRHRALVKDKRLWLASVVPQQIHPWKTYCQPPIDLGDVPLQGTYPTLGIDRALALWGAGQRYGFPALVIDGGTALTYTGADGTQTLVGGAILPGLGLQLRSLHQSTGLLPLTDLTPDHASDRAPEQAINRWAMTTQGAIASGVLHSAIAGVESFLTDWWRQYPTSAVLFTGGDGRLLRRYLPSETRRQTQHDPHLGFWGLQQVRQALIR